MQTTTTRCLHVPLCACPCCISLQFPVHLHLSAGGVDMENGCHEQDEESDEDEGKDADEGEDDEDEDDEDGDEDGDEEAANVSLARISCAG